MQMRPMVLMLGIRILAASTTAAQTNWPQFRGASGGVVVDSPVLPETWGPRENIAWSIDVAGRSWSSPIVWDDHVFVLSVVTVDGPETPL